MKIIVLILITLLVFPAYSAFANPSQSGSTGLLIVPSADTLDAGNICVGAWSEFSKNSSNPSKGLQQNSLILPVTITLGIGTFWEIYGAYPNLLFNQEEGASGHGTLDIGTKMRFLGGRSSTFKVAADFLAQRHVSEDQNVDGVTDLSTKVIASFSLENFGAHLYAGYLFPGNRPDISQKNALIYGAGLEYMLLPRFKMTTELVGNTGRTSIDDYSMEASIGAQYFISPHLTLNASAGTGFGKNDPDMRLMLGVSSCQGIGSYVTPIPSVGRKFALKEAPKTLKPLKIIPISTLLLKASAAKDSPASKLEVEVESDNEDVIIKPYGQITIAPQQASSNLTSPVIPVEIPLKTTAEEIVFQPQKSQDLEASAIDYTMNRIRGITPLFGVDVKGTQVVVPPAAPLPETMSVYRKFRFPDLTFDFDQWTISGEGKKMLSEVAEQIRKDKKWLYLKIDGHTDNIGSMAYNMDLSLKRAVSVATHLISFEGIDPAKIFIKGLGKSTPLADNATSDGRRKNRRTELLFLVNKGGS